MYEFTVEKTLDAPLEKVWAVVADFANLDWFAGAERVEKVGDGVGQIRRIFMPGSDQPVEEELLVLSPATHQLEYAVLEGPVNIMRDYRVTASLADAGEGRTLAVWQASFAGVTIDEVSPEDMINVMQATYDSMLGAVAVAAAD